MSCFCWLRRIGLHGTTLHSSFKEATTETTRQAERYETRTHAAIPETEAGRFRRHPRMISA